MVNAKAKLSGRRQGHGALGVSLRPARRTTDQRVSAKRARGVDESAVGGASGGRVLTAV